MSRVFVDVLVHDQVGRSSNESGSATNVGREGDGQHHHGPVLAPQLHQDGLEDGDHHGGAGGVADPHGQEGGRQHEPQQHESGRASDTQQDSQTNSSESQIFKTF